MNPNLILRTVTTPYGDITLNSVLSHSNLDNNFIGLKSNLIYTATTDNGILSFTKINGETIDVSINGLNDIYVSAMTFNVGTYDLTLERNDGINFTENLSILATDMTVTGGSYNINSGVVTFTNNSGGTFNVSGFVSGYTDIYTTGGTFNSNSGVLSLVRTDNNLISVSGFTDINVTGGTYSNGTAVFNNNTGGTFSISGFSTGYTLSSSAITNTLGYTPLSAYTDTNTFVTGGTYSNGTAVYTNNTGGTFSVTGFSTGSGSTTGPDTYVTGGTYSDGTTVFNNNTGGTFSVTGFSTGYTLTSNEIVNTLGYTPLSAYTDTDTFITGGTYSNGTTDLTNNTGGTISINGFFTSSDDIYTTAFTFNQGTYDLTVSNSDGNDFTQNLGILSSDMTITGGTYNPTSGVGTFINNSGGTFDVSGFLTGQTDTYIVSGTSNNNTGTLTLRRSDNANITVTGFTSGTSINWYAENTALPATKPVATGFNSVAFGNNAKATGSYMFVYGPSAGNGATNANDSNFMGQSAGISGVNAYSSNFFGRYAGQNATTAYQSNFMGMNSGLNATNANNSNFLGYSAGYVATNAASSNFIGQNAGYQASNASYSTLIGYNAGRNNGNNIGSNNIIIGTNIGLPTSTSNAINLGGVLFGTGTYSTISVTPSVTGQTNGRIGIGIVTPLETLHISGKTRVEGGLMLKLLSGSTSITNLGIDVNGNVVSGTTFTGGTVNGATNFTSSLSANSLTSSNITITLPTLTGSTGEIAYFGSGTGFTAGLVYYFNSSSQWVVANATTVSSSKYLIGIALGTSITNGMLIRGYARYSVGNYSSVTTGDILYLSTTNGLFQTTAPSTSSQVVRVIGYCIDSANTTIYFNPDNTWVEIL